jgi:sugar phosphate isomerase/epimerase
MAGREVVDLAAEYGLSHVEMPRSMLADTPEAAVDLGSYARDRGVGFVVASGQVLNGGLEADLELAAALGAPAVRCTVSGVLCGDRRGFPGGWREHLRRCERELDRTLPAAERLQVAIGIENHQDADSEDLLALCRRFESRHLGVTLDCGNPLAVMEEPVAFARRLGPYLRHAHLKDYTVHHAPNGFRLVRCALGDGVIDFPGLFEVMDAQEWPVTRSIEMAALHARLIPVLDPSWWDEYAPRDARDALPALSVVWNNLRLPEEEWRTPFERDAPGEELLEYERRQLRTSVDYLRQLCRL